MKITFLGTSDGVPRKNHFCSATMIEVKDRLYLIDAGAPVIDLMLKEGKHPDMLRAFFNTHPHTDHTDGIIPLVTLAGWHYLNAAFDLFVADDSVTDAIVSYYEIITREKYPGDRLRHKTITEGTFYDDGYIKVSAIPTRHCPPMPSYAFIVEAEGKRAVFSGDMSYLLRANDFPDKEITAGADLFVCEMAHFGAEELLPYIKECGAKRVIFNHYQARKTEDIASLAGLGLPFAISAANDGDVLEL